MRQNIKFKATHAITIHCLQQTQVLTAGIFFIRIEEYVLPLELRFFLEPMFEKKSLGMSYFYF